MHFSKLSAAVLGLSSFAAASPIAIPEGSLAAREATPAEKGLVWSPRSVKERQIGSSFGSGSSRNIDFGRQFNNKQFGNDNFDRFGQFDNKFGQFNDKFGFGNNKFGNDRDRRGGFDNFLDFCSFDNGNRFNRNNGRNIVIARPINVINQNIIVVQQQINLINVIKKNIFIDGGNRFRDNIRRNHFRNSNRGRNNQVNIITIVVTEVIDISNGNRNQRFLTRQVESNPEFSSREFVVVSERSAFTVGPSDIAEFASSTEGVTTATATSVSVPLSTGVSAAVVKARDEPETVEWSEASALDVSSNFLLLPEGQSAPTWEGQATQSADPASILDDGETGFAVTLPASA